MSTPLPARVKQAILGAQDMSDLGERIEALCRAVRAEALEQVLAGIAREQCYREYCLGRGPQDGSAVSACKEIANYVRAMMATPTTERGDE